MGGSLELVLSSMGIGTIDNQREHCIIATISLLCSIGRVTMVQLEGVGRRLASPLSSPHSQTCHSEAPGVWRSP